MPLNKPLAGSAEDWLLHARSDLSLAKIKRSNNEILAETLCYHAQQAVEKSLKAVLVFFGIEPPKTHNIGMLIEQMPNTVVRSAELSDAKALTDYAVSTRYPGDFEAVTDKELEQAIQTAESVLAFAKRIIETRSE
jgi:HEPN domain-containing protein